jgi:hypothetical protein
MKANAVARACIVHLYSGEPALSMRSGAGVERTR